jgi:hypothetical protein
MKAGHLVVATPCYGGLVTQRYMQSVCALLVEARDTSLKVSVQLIGYDSLVPRARNSLVSTFMDDATATHLMFIDADIGFDIEQMARMLNFDAEMVAGLYPLKVVDEGQEVFQRLNAGETLRLAQTRYVGVPEPEGVCRRRDGFVTADFAGCGFLLIARSALEKMIKAYPELRYVASHNSSEPSLSRHQYALFDCMIDPQTRVYLSEDYAFCRRWRAIGGELWLDARSRLMHIGPVEFVGDACPRFDLSANASE